MGDNKLTRKEERVEGKAPVYSKEELMNVASSAFGVKPEVIAGAVRLAGKEHMTKADMEKAIKDFLEREVPSKRKKERKVK